MVLILNYGYFILINDKLLLGTLAIVLIAGLGTPVFAQADLAGGMDPADAEGVANPQSVLSSQEEDCSDIDYTFTGTGSGTLGTIPFSDSDFTVTIWANTCDVMEIFSPGAFTVLATAAEVEIESIGTVLVTEETGVFANNGNGALGWSFFDGDDLDFDIYDLFDVLPPPYDLTTDFGPLVDANPSVTSDPVSTDAGPLSFTSATDATFEAQLKDDMMVGGDLLPIDATALLLAAANSPSAWVTSLAIAALGIGAYVFTRNPSNMRNIKVILRDYLDRL